MLLGDTTRLFVRNVRQFALYHGKALFLGFGSSVIGQVFRKRHQGIRMAIVKDLTVFAEAHEPVARTPSAITSRAEAGYVVVVHQPADNLIERALVRYVKLLSIMRTLRLVVTADTGAGPTRNLAYAILQSMFTHLLTFTSRDNHAGIGHGNANKGNDLLEYLVGNAVVKHLRVDVHRRLTRGTLMVCGPTPCTASKCSACMIKPANS